MNTEKLVMQRMH